MFIKAYILQGEYTFKIFFNLKLKTQLKTFFVLLFLKINMCWHHVCDKTFYSKIPHCAFLHGERWNDPMKCCQLFPVSEVRGSHDRQVVYLQGELSWQNTQLQKEVGRDWHWLKTSDRYFTDQANLTYLLFLCLNSRAKVAMGLNSD